MPRTIRPMLAGNWKMNGTAAALDELRAMVEAGPRADLELVVCMPATLVARARDIADSSSLQIGGQDCHAAASGAHTGDVSAEMLADAGASHVIVGHSERRADHGETDADVAAKAEAAWRAGLVAIICIGETRQQRETGETLEVLARQIDGSVPDGATAANCVLAYEPVWAIGTGLTPSEADVADAHAHIRRRLGERIGTAAAGVRLLYGGSVKPDNARSLMTVAEVDGALVGGASLKARDFMAIADAFGAS